MRVSALAGLLACLVVFTVSGNASASAEEALDLSQVITMQTGNSGQTLLPLQGSLKPIEEVPPAPPAPPEPVTYTVAAGDTLTDIAAVHQTTWRRLFDKNTVIQHPDIIKVGDQLTIPLADEQLAQRPLPEPVVQHQEAAQTVAVQRRAPARPAVAKPAVQISRGSSAGNTYTRGYCTWYAKDRRPDLPNNLGNASTWVSRARAQGIPTGSAPRAGAIGQQGNHVVYVERVNGDGTVTVSEMNYRGLYQISSRTVPASYFQYIY